MTSSAASDDAGRRRCPQPWLAAKSPARRRRASPGDQRLDRWSAVTLPHDVKFDEFAAFCPQSIRPSRAEPRADHLSPTGPWCLRK